MIIQGKMPPVVMKNGKIICEFTDGKAEVDSETAKLLISLGYRATEETNDNTGTAGSKAESKNTADKPGRGRKPARNSSGGN